jgi:hypothetical protein
MRQMLAAVVALLLLPAAALAQPSAVPRQHPGEEVIVIQSTSGEEIRGQIVELSATTLAMLVGGRRVDVPIGNVLRIDGQHDSVKNGAAIGAVTMGGLAALGCSSALGSSGYCVTSALLYTGLGALAGAGIDALHKGRTTIYSKPSPVAVALGPARKGARAQVRVSW